MLAIIPSVPQSLERICYCPLDKQGAARCGGGDALTSFSFWPDYEIKPIFLAATPG